MDSCCVQSSMLDVEDGTVESASRAALPQPPEEDITARLDLRADEDGCDDAERCIVDNAMDARMQ
jgi:hypothetical protein